MKKVIFPCLILFFCSIIRLSAQSSIVHPIVLDQLQKEVSTLTELTVESVKAVHLKAKPFECKIFPMQVENNLQVILPMSDNFTFRLVDVDGNVLFSHYQIFGENQVNLSHLKANKYFVEISSDKGKIVEEITKT